MRYQPYHPPTEHDESPDSEEQDALDRADTLAEIDYARGFGRPSTRDVTAIEAGDALYGAAVAW